MRPNLPPLPYQLDLILTTFVSSLFPYDSASDTPSTESSHPFDPHFQAFFSFFRSNRSVTMADNPLSKVLKQFPSCSDFPGEAAFSVPLSSPQLRFLCFDWALASLTCKFDFPCRLFFRDPTGFPAATCKHTPLFSRPCTYFVTLMTGDFLTLRRIFFRFVALRVPT